MSAGTERTLRPRIVFLYDHDSVPPPIIEMVEQRVPPGFDLELLEQGAPAEERRERIAGADFVMAYPGDPSREELELATRLRLFQILSAGYEWLDLELFARIGVPLANNGGANAPTVAEHAILLMLALFKKLPLHHQSLRQGQWLGARETLKMRELGGKRLGIIGFGRIGRELARIASGFRTSTSYYDVERASPAVETEFGVRYAPFDTLLRESDVVSIHTPLTADTEGCIDARALALMKPSAILINTSRGAVVDEPALIDALQHDRIAGAGLDVFMAEPLASDSPLLSLENVVLTSHIAGVTLDTWARRIEFGYANIARVAAGAPPESVII